MGGIALRPGGSRPHGAGARQHAPRVRPLIQTPFIERNGVVSPDGRWLAYESDNDSGRLEIYVRPFPDVKAGLWQISTDGGRRPLWAPGGRELFYVAPDRALMAVPVDGRGTTWSHGRATKVVEGVYKPEAATASGRMTYRQMASVSLLSNGPPISPRRGSSSSRTGSRN